MVEAFGKLPIWATVSTGEYFLESQSSNGHEFNLDVVCLSVMLQLSLNVTVSTRFLDAESLSNIKLFFDLCYTSFGEQKVEKMIQYDCCQNWFAYHPGLPESAIEKLERVTLTCGFVRFGPWCGTKRALREKTNKLEDEKRRRQQTEEELTNKRRRVEQSEQKLERQSREAASELVRVQTHRHQLETQHNAFLVIHQRERNDLVACQLELQRSREELRVLRQTDIATVTEERDQLLRQAQQCEQFIRNIQEAEAENATQFDQMENEIARLSDLVTGRDQDMYVADSHNGSDWSDVGSNGQDEHVRIKQNVLYRECF
ncbi:unnamed protein product [Cylindrotheca closterium]|uniref:Uncharacterized protein n=1 Tax=Cylindrotheca closterium TaxID=2856 RepID=A0AAD2CEC0_9STRA|nr:unnamed protein product [Cylindrotheca closterium]